MKNTFIKRALSLTAAALLLLVLAGCAGLTTSGSANASGGANASESAGVQATAASDSSITAVEATGEFTITTEDGAYTQDGSVYTVTKAGTYTLTGALNGRIVVSAGEEDEVVLELSGTAITCSEDSPIKILCAGKVEISAKKDTENVINDARAEKTADDDAQGLGAITADCDLKLKGAGTLVVNASYNNGVHTTHDLTIQKLSLKVTAVNNALKGNDSITVKSGTVVAISTKGDGLKTESTDANKYGVTRGDVTVTGGSVAIYAAGDGIQAAHNFNLTADEEGNTGSVSIFTGSYSAYTAQSAATDSYKGVKAENEIIISAGSIDIQSYDDGLHANYGTAFETGEKGLGNITVSGGSVTMTVYSPENATGGGFFGPGFGFGGGFGMGMGGHGGSGGWSGQQTVSGADAIHADGTLTISGGSITIDSAYEGLEANVINVTGGTTVVTAVDDGVNATKGTQTPQVNISGGILDVTVSPNGDTDGIDSNGIYTQTGGLVITRGPNSQMAAALDAESSVSITGGTLIILGFGRVSTGSGVKSCSLSLHSQGSHTVTYGEISYTFTNSSSYGQTLCYSSEAVSGK